MSCGSSKDERDHIRLARPGVPARRIAPDRAHVPGAAAARARHHRDAGDPAVIPGRGRHVPQAAGPRRGFAPGRLGRLGLREDGRDRRADRDPGRPAVDADVPDRGRRLDADPPLLGRLHGRRSRLHALLRVPELLRLQHAAAGPGVELLPADHRLGVRRRRLVLPDQLLVPAHHRDAGRHQGVRDQRARRRGARARDVLRLPRRPHARLPADVRPDRRRVHPQRSEPGRRLHPAADRRVREVRPGPAAHLAPGRDGGPDAGLRADPCGHDGDRGGVPDRAPAPAVRARAGRSRGRRDRRLRHAADRRHDRPGGDRSQARHRVLDDVPDRLHDHGRLVGRLCRRHVPPDDARVLQGAALHGGRLGHLGDGRHPEPRPHVGLPQGDAVHVRDDGHRRPRALGRAAVLGRVLEGRDPVAGARPRRLARGARRDRLPRRVHDRDLHVPDDLPRVHRRPVPGGAGARARPPLPRAGAGQPDDRRGRGHRRRLPRPRAPHRRAGGRDEGRDGHARVPRDRRRPAADPGRRRGDPQVPRADVRRLAAVLVARARHRHAVGRARPRRRDRPGRHRGRVAPVGRRAAAGARVALRRAARLPRQQVVLRRDHRLPRRAAGRLARTLRLQHDRAGARAGRARRRRERYRARAVGGGARRADRLSALLRRPAAGRAHRARRLLPRLRMTIHLSILVFWPLAFGLLSLFAPRGAAAFTLMVGTLIPLAYAILLVTDFDTGLAGLQYVTNDKWIPELGIRYKLGIDGLNLWLVLLTTVVAFAVAVWLMVRPQARPGLFAFHFGLGATAVLGAVVAQDLALFVLFCGLMLVPFYFLVGQWGGPDRIAAALKMVIYTLVGSLLMLAGAVATAVIAGAGPGGHISFVLSDLMKNPLPESTQKWIFVTFALAFLIKMPAFPFHGWMPDAYRTMPLPALAFFSGVVSKVAAYGFLRLVLPLFPAAVEDFHTILLILALVSILYGSIQAFTQTNARLILGYSSVAQLGFITLGIFALDPSGQGAQGALLQAVNHGLVVAPLFFVIALLAERAEGSEDIRDYGGIAFRAPVLATLFLIAALAPLAMPGSANFAGEFLILLGVFNSKLTIALIASLGVILASVYALRFYIRSMHNRVGPKVSSFELRMNDAVVLVPLVLVILAFALYPQKALESGQKAVQATVARVNR